MTNPFQINPANGVVQGQGDFGAIAQGIGGVLAAMQQSRENQYRMQQIQNEQLQQAALQRYYEAMASAQQQELGMKAGEQAIIREGQRQVGGALRRAITGPRTTPARPSTATSVPSRGGAPQMPGLVAPGNIDLKTRPVVRNPDGTISTVRSMSFSQGGREILIPTIGPDGQVLSDRQAVALYHKTGKHLGIFSSPATATAYAQALHQQQAQQYGGTPGGGADASAGVFQQVLSSAVQALDPAMQRALEGVADENVPAAIEGLRALQPKSEELPTAGREFMFAQHLAQIDPRLAKFFIDNWVNKPGVTVNNLPPIPVKAQTAFAVKDAEQQAAALAKSEEAARGAVAAMPSITEAYGVLGKGTPFTGLASKQKLFAARIAAALGVPNADIRVSDTQTLWRLAGETTLSYLRSRDLGSGTAVSNSDRDYMAALAGQDFTQQPIALRRIMRINFGSLILRQGDAIAQLKAQAGDNPEMAVPLLRRERAITRQYETAWKQYARMLAGEGVSEAEIRSRMVESGIQDPEPILRGLPKPPTVRQEADSIAKAILRGRGR